MHMFRRVGALVLGVVAATAFAAADAAAFTGISRGDPVTVTLASPSFAFSSIGYCTGLTIDGTVSSDAGAGNGGEIVLSTAGFTGCSYNGSRVLMTANGLPWTLSIDGSGDATIAGVNTTMRWGILFCSHSGTLGMAYDQTSGDGVLIGSVIRYAGSSLCGTSWAIVGTLNLVDASSNPVAL